MDSMRKIAFLIAIIGLGILVAFLLKEPIHVSSLDGLTIGQSVEIKGIVTEERKWGNGKLLMVGINEIPVFCECSKNYIGLNVEVYGMIEKFPDDLRVKAFTIKTLD